MFAEDEGIEIGKDGQQYRGRKMEAADWIRSWLYPHALSVLGYHLDRAFRLGWLHFDSQDGLRMWPEELVQAFEQRTREIQSTVPQVKEHLATLPSPSAAFEVFWKDLEGDLKSGVERGLIWYELSSRVGLSAVEIQLLAVLVLLETDYAMARAYRYAWANFQQSKMTWGFAVTLLTDSTRPSSEVGGALNPQVAPLFQSGLVQLGPQGPILAERELSLSLTVANVLLGRSWEADEHLPHWSLPTPPERHRSMLQSRYKALLGQRLRVAISGPKGSGRRAIAGQLSLAARGGIFDLSLGRAVAQGSGLVAIEQALQLSTLLDLAVVVSELDRLPAESERLWIERVEHTFRHSRSALIWLFEAEPPPYLEVPPTAQISVGYPSRELRRQAWSAAFSARLSETEMAQLAGQFLLSEGQIQRVVQQGQALTTPDHKEWFTHLNTLARREAALGLGRLATPETGKVSFDQLIVAPETATTLQEIQAYARHRQTLSQQWGFGESLPYGLGMVALFSGPPGTGKTFAALALANALGLELYRVDVSSIVSKFIGETEKNLAEIFAAAEQGEIILLFDEADSLFGKRTEVKTSVDRYANLEINYLLQRMEQFAGLTILTTNFDTGIDDAFKRRIRFEVRFAEPDEASRFLLWRKLIPPAVPLNDDVNFSILAKHFAFSGGHIKEVILRAASLALHGGTNVTQSLLIRSAKAEYQKLGKLVSHDALDRALNLLQPL